MTPALAALIFQYGLQYGPKVFEIGAKLVDDFEKGRTQTTVTAADFAELDRLSKLTAAQIFAQAGVSVPPTL